MPRLLHAIAALCLLAPAVSAQPKASEPGEPLAKALKPFLIKAMPAKLYEKVENWDHQVMVPVGLKWRGIKPKISKSLRNDGEWRKTIISTRNLDKTLQLRIYDVKNVNAEKQTFKVHLEFQMEVYYDQQNWESGLRLWSGSVRARTQLKLDMDCENTLRVEFDKNNLPDFILRLRVTDAKVAYDDLVVEHINGIGGDAAKLIGKSFHKNLNRLRPGIERDLLDKASKAIVKTADTREIRVGFGGLMKAK